MEDNKKQNIGDEPVRLEFKDVVAMTIAAIEVLFPIALMFAAIMAVVFFVVLKFWIK
ncbi:MAG: hypothetical protein N2594_06570 [Clostridiales bacterium]|nr:hypothetical protein [Clostridiales bacterium]